jgi:alkylation response protein AidB-like acyl-CoA dehydrogenase
LPFGKGYFILSFFTQNPYTVVVYCQDFTTMSSPVTLLYSDPLYLTRSASPYYRESHLSLQRELREYVDIHISPFCEEWETSGKVPDEVLACHAQLGYAAVSVYPLAKEYLGGQRLPADIKASEWDGFHDLIFIDEIARCGYLGVIRGLSCGNSIGAPPLVNFGNAEQKRRFLPDVLQGRSRFCLGVTEPDGKLSSEMNLTDGMLTYGSRIRCRIAYYNR